MSSNRPDPTKPHGLIVSPSTGLMKLPTGGSSALSEIISRSLLHIQTRAELVVSARKAGEERVFEIAPGVKIVMCWIPPGEFLMGSPNDEEERENGETQHPVKITQGFWLAKMLITQAQWLAVTRFNPSSFRGEFLPVEQVSWLDICGDESGNGGFLGILNKFSGINGRYYLPTEAQWEYACRAGKAGAYSGNLDEMGWYRDNSNGSTHPVGQKNANDWGLHDMHGNVWEWCSDGYRTYDRHTTTDPEGPTSEIVRIRRGGSWSGSTKHCRSACRNTFLQGNSSNSLGFRLACSPVPIATNRSPNDMQRGTSGVMK